jgi:hypothetical protein
MLHVIDVDSGVPGMEAKVFVAGAYTHSRQSST